MTPALQNPKDPRRKQLPWHLLTRRSMTIQQSKKRRPLRMWYLQSLQTPRQRSTPTAVTPMELRVLPSPRRSPQAAVSELFASCKYFHSVSFTPFNLYFTSINFSFLLNFERNLVVLLLLITPYYPPSYTTSSYFSSPPLPIP